MVKNQHYVFRKYLVPWSDDLKGEKQAKKRKIWVYRKKIHNNQEPYSQEKIVNIASQNYYFDITGYDDADLGMIKELLEYVQREHIITLEFDFHKFNAANVQRDFLENHFMSQIENYDNKYHFLQRLQAGDSSFYMDNEAQRLLKKIRKIKMEYPNNNISHEDISALLRESEELSDKNIDNPKYIFVRFLCIQYCRTLKVHNMLNEIIEKYKQKNDIQVLNSKIYINMLSIYIAEEMAISIVNDFNTSLMIINNETSSGFITSDSPVFNAYSDDCMMKQKISVDDMTGCTYYPVSPKTAAAIIYSRQEHENSILTLHDEDDLFVQNLNSIMFRNAEEEVFSDSRDLLSEVVSQNNMT